LYDLRRDFNFYVSGKEPADIEEEALAKFLEQIDWILQDELKAWLRLREEITPMGGQTPTIHIS